jgi:hypothetical protein
LSVLHYDLRGDARLSFCAKAVSSRSLEKAGVAELADALDSKFRNGRFYLINRGEMPFTIFHREIKRFRCDQGNHRGMLLR